MENGFEVAFGPLDAGFAAAYAADVDEEIVQEGGAAVAVAAAAEGALLAPADDDDLADEANEGAPLEQQGAGALQPTVAQQQEFDLWWIQNSTRPEEEDEEAAITMGQILDGVVGGKTLGTYVGDIMNFLGWLLNNHVDLVTPYGAQRLHMIQIARPLERSRPRSTRLRLQWKALLRGAHTHPLVKVFDLTPVLFLEYVMTLRHHRHGGYLGKSAYGNKRSALFHLFRLHNKSGFPDHFKLELNNLFRGFYRRLQQQRPAIAAAVNAGENIDPNIALPAHRHMEGKDPISVELYELLGRRFVGWGTIDGVFAFAFLVITFNLSCRSQNTGNIRLSDLAWSTSFDSFAVFFAHTKTDQTGEEAKYPRHLFANAGRPYCCPVFALALYFACCVNMPQAPNDKLFPGKEQHTRFSNILVRCLTQYSDEVRALGFRPADIGTHSIRKGAVSYLSSMIGGPPAAAICIRAGWTMGRVRDIYMRYITSGDTFVGWCLSLLPILSVEFGGSPPPFSNPGVGRLWETGGG